MKKVAIVTLFHGNYNFGGQLQAYALQKVIAGYGIECEVVNYHPRNKYKRIRVLKFSVVIFRFYHKAQFKIHVLTSKKLKQDFKKKSELFESFMREIPQTKEYCDDMLSDIKDRYDYWISGSDQVWNPEIFYGAPLYLLKGVQGKKISYAASSSNAYYNKKQTEELKISLSDFTALSCREEALTNAIHRVTEKEVFTVLDPTLLPDSKAWDELSIKPDVDEKYAFVYLIHASDIARKNIYYYCHKHNLKMIIVPHAQGWYKSAEEKYYDIQATAIGPKEWIGYIKYAEIVFTDSFHGTIFSVNYHKNFISFEKLTGNEEVDVQSRKYSILKQLSLLERCVPYSFDLEDRIVKTDIDYSMADKVMKELRTSSEDFLKKALDIEG
ncbi:MAG: polysaccharide pyruvyl transferase family protein [Bacteroides sp.]|nr:polysaccharide pyruvyl transferase family protein [Eubacterium sp.]MCM1419063.1 polysaccharide pyruvyl transferase family protein [Roseburia sp.]MCM1461750.1 polysaccharide pyruvyl transferase family protein [Bacteroides sp.]